jgi:hypothetical protein
MTTFTISANDCRSIASLISFTDKDMERMANIHVRIEDGKAFAIATDRYKIGTWTTENIDTDETDSIEFGITPAMAKWLTAIKLPKDSRGHGIDFDLNEQELRATYVGSSFISAFSLDSEFMTKVASYIPTGDIPEQPAKAFALSVKHLADISKVIDRNGKKVETLVFTETTRTSDRPAPFIITALGCPEFKVLLQPNIVR